MTMFCGSCSNQFCSWLAPGPLTPLGRFDHVRAVSLRVGANRVSPARPHSAKSSSASSRTRSLINFVDVAETLDHSVLLTEQVHDEARRLQIAVGLELDLLGDALEVLVA